VARSLREAYEERHEKEIPHGAHCGKVQNVDPWHRDITGRWPETQPAAPSRMAEISDASI
jgi:hypothetical protein